MITALVTILDGSYNLNDINNLLYADLVSNFLDDTVDTLRVVININNAGYAVVLDGSASGVHFL